MSDKLIRSLFEGRLNTWAGARVPPLPVAWENESFTPPAAGAPYLRAFVLPGATASRDLSGDNRHYVGVFQITISCPPGKGSGAALSISDELAALFPMNLRLASGAFWVQQLSPLRVRGALDKPDRYDVPVDFAYEADFYPT